MICYFITTRRKALKTRRLHCYVPSWGWRIRREKPIHPDDWYRFVEVFENRRSRRWNIRNDEIDNADFKWRMG